jgi:hypothetical protein
MRSPTTRSNPVIVFRSSHSIKPSSTVTKYFHWRRLKQGRKTSKYWRSCSDKHTIGLGMVLSRDWFLVDSNYPRWNRAFLYQVLLKCKDSDLDIWIDRTTENADRLIQALQDFGFGSLGLQTQDFLEVDQIIQLGYPPNRIDLLTSIPGVHFEDCYNSKHEIVVMDAKINFIDLENLRKNKRASGRLQDLADLEKLDDMEDSISS